MAVTKHDDDNDDFNHYLKETAKMIMKNNPSISYESAIAEAKRWA